LINAPASKVKPNTPRVIVVGIGFAVGIIYLVR